MEESWLFWTTGIVLGIGAGTAPGPLLALSVAETLRHGWSGGFKVALAPVCTDGPLILVSWLLLSSLADVTPLLGGLGLAGSAFLFYLAWESLTIKGVDLELPEVRSRSLSKGIFTNLLNPSPYLFWFTVGTPTLIEASKLGSLPPFGFLFCFFVLIVGSKLVLVAVVARARDFLKGAAYLTLMRLLGVALTIFALLFARRSFILLEWWP